MSDRIALDRRERDFAAALTEAERIYLEELAAFMEKRPPKPLHR